MSGKSEKLQIFQCTIIADIVKEDIFLPESQLICKETELADVQMRIGIIATMIA
jgi:hypothetical protein